jgi:hypothetical protein
MDPAVMNLIEPVVVFATLLGMAFGVKILVWGKGPIRRVRPPTEAPGLEQRLGSIEERLERTAAMIGHVADQVADVDERLEFTERMLSRQRMDEPKALERPDV